MGRFLSMEVVVKPYLFLRQALGAKEINLDLPKETNVQELLKVLRLDYGLPENFKTAVGSLKLLDGYIPVGLLILVNGHNIRQLQGLDTILADGDIISLFPPAAGG